jgi:hypothetical protein
MNALFPTLIIVFVLIASVTAIVGPRWMIWISFGSSFLLGLSVAMLIYDFPVNLLIGSVLGTFMGIFFGLSGSIARQYRQKGLERLQEAISYLNKSGIAEDEIFARLFPDERLLKESPAKHFRRLNGVGGEIYLTNKRLVFIPNPLHYEKYELSIPLERVLRAEPYRINWVINKGVIIVLRNGDSEKFSIKQRMEWIQQLEFLLSYL